MFSRDKRVFQYLINKKKQKKKNYTDEFIYVSNIVILWKWICATETTQTTGQTTLSDKTILKLVKIQKEIL